MRVLQFFLGLAAGVGVGVFVGGFIGGFTSYVSLHEARKREPLEEVIVANRDLGPGEAVPFEAVSRRPVPKRLVTSSLLRPNMASTVVGAQLTVPLKTGDVFFRAMLPKAEKGVGLMGDAAVEECTSQLESLEGAPKFPASIQEIRQSLEKGGGR